MRKPGTCSTSRILACGTVQHLGHVQRSAVDRGVDRVTGVAHVAHGLETSCGSSPSPPPLASVEACYPCFERIWRHPVGKIHDDDSTLLVHSPKFAVRRVAQVTLFHNIKLPYIASANGVSSRHAQSSQCTLRLLTESSPEAHEHP